MQGRGTAKLCLKPPGDPKDTHPPTVEGEGARRPENESKGGLKT